MLLLLLLLRRRRWRRQVFVRSVARRLRVLPQPPWLDGGRIRVLRHRLGTCAVLVRASVPHVLRWGPHQRVMVLGPIVRSCRRCHCVLLALGLSSSHLHRHLHRHLHWFLVHWYGRGTRWMWTEVLCTPEAVPRKATQPTQSCSNTYNQNQNPVSGLAVHVLTLARFKVVRRTHAAVSRKRAR